MTLPHRGRMTSPEQQEEESFKVDVAYLDLFRDPYICIEYPWAWIFEQFPFIGFHQLTIGYTEQSSHTCRWEIIRGFGDIFTTKNVFDVLQPKE
ncbi:hypothetical protein CR513_51848, partial [Mucuna pruriens]